MQADIDEADMWLGDLRHRLMDRRERGNAPEKFSDYTDKALRLELEDKVNMQQRVLAVLCWQQCPWKNHLHRQCCR